MELEILQNGDLKVSVNKRQRALILTQYSDFRADFGEFAEESLGQFSPYNNGWF